VHTLIQTKPSLHIRSQLRWFSLYTLSNEALFWGPIITISITQLGHMTVSEVLMLEASYLILCIVLEPISGALADTIGRKKCLVVSSGVLVLAMTTLACMQSIEYVYAGNVLWAIGSTLRSGADSSLLYETLQRAHVPHWYKKVQGKLLAMRAMLFVATSLATGFLAAYSMRLPLLLCIPPMIFSLYASSKLIETHVVHHRYSMRAHWTLLWKGTLAVLQTPVLWWIALFACLMRSFGSVQFWLTNPYFEAVAFPLFAFGMFFAVGNILSAAGSYGANRLDERPEYQAIIFLMALEFVPSLLAGFYPGFVGVGLLVLHSINRNLTALFIEHYIHEHVTNLDDDSAGRATVLSVLSAAGQLSAALALGGVSLVGTAVSPPLLIGYSALGCIVCAGGLMALYSTLGIAERRDVAV
jgi:MFS family permease